MKALWTGLLGLPPVPFSIPLRHQSLPLSHQLLQIREDNMTNLNALDQELQKQTRIKDLQEQWRRVETLTREELDLLWQHTMHELNGCLYQ